VREQAIAAEAEKTPTPKQKRELRRAAAQTTEGPSAAKSSGGVRLEPSGGV